MKIAMLKRIEDERNEKKIVANVYEGYGKIQENALIYVPLDSDPYVALEERGYSLVSSQEELESIALPLIAAYRQKVEEEKETRRMGNVLKVLDAEQDMLIALQEKYPREKMAEELAQNPHPTAREALERGLAWSMYATGNRAIFHQEEDGSISSTALGALYIGCYGDSNVPMDAEVAGGLDLFQTNEAFNEMLVRIQDAIRYWKRRNGSYRDANRDGALASAANRGVRWSTTPWWHEFVQSKIDNMLTKPRTDLLFECDRIDAKLTKQRAKEMQNWQERYGTSGK